MAYYCMIIFNKLMCDHYIPFFFLNRSCFPLHLTGFLGVAASTSPRPHFARLLEGEQTETEIRPRAVQVADAGFTNENGEGSCRAVYPLVNIQTAT
jgi:hypothetical protein